MCVLIRFAYKSILFGRAVAARGGEDEAGSESYDHDFAFAKD